MATVFREQHSGESLGEFAQRKVSMTDTENRSNFTVTGMQNVFFTPYQRAFVREVPEHVKKVIRLVKLWKKENHLDIPSYSLELLTISVWRSLGKGNPGTSSLFRKVMRQLATCGALRVAFDDNYNSVTYTRRMPAPYILDPANPYMDTLDGVSIPNVSMSAKIVLGQL